MIEQQLLTHTILGAGGFAGNSLAAELMKHQVPVRLASRREFRMDGTASVRCDLLMPEDVVHAVQGSAVVYLTAGVSYDARQWKSLWPRIMANTIEACTRMQVPLVFFDNVYMYGRVDGIMTEETPFNPCSIKGEVRASIARQLLNAIARGDVQGLIARAADVYGPYGGATCTPHRFVLERVLAGKPVQWLGNDRMPHSYSYTLDCARGMRILASHPDAFGQTWHLPTAAPAIDGVTFSRLAAEALGRTTSVKLLSRGMLRFAGLFNRGASETIEMFYQNDRPYLFDSSKFERRFGVAATPYEQGIRETLQFLRMQ